MKMFESSKVRVEVFLMLAATLSVFGQLLPEDKDQPIVLCGRKLAVAHHLVCSAYYGISPDKRSVLNRDKEYDIVLAPLEPWTGPQVVSAGRDKRMIAGLADDCCLKACTVHDIEEYC